MQHGAGSSNVDAEVAVLESLLPPGCVVSLGSDHETPDPLFPEEEPAVARALEKRRREFALGRSHARRALLRLGVTPCAIAVRRDRAPLWPAGVVGTITHTAGLVAAAAGHGSAYEGLGLDVESRERPLPGRLARFVLTPAERERVDGLPASLDALRLLFSAKEAVHKCVAPVSGHTLGFHDVEVDIDVASASFAVRRVARSPVWLPDFGRLAGRFAVSERYVMAVVHLAAAPTTDSRAGVPLAERGAQPGLERSGAGAAR